MSTTHCNHEYEKPLFPAFDHMIRIINDIENRKILRVDVRDENHHTRGKLICSGLSTELSKQELSLVPSR